MAVDIELVAVDKPGNVNVIVGQAHFIKTVEDLHEALAGVSQHLRFGVAFCEASGDRLVRRSGNDAELTGAAVAAAEAIGAGHSFVIMMAGGFPVSVMNQVKAVPEVCTIFCATANPVGILVRRSPRTETTDQERITRRDAAAAPSLATSPCPGRWRSVRRVRPPGCS